MDWRHHKSVTKKELQVVFKTNPALQELLCAVVDPEGVPGWFRCYMQDSRPSATKMKVLQS